MGLLNDFNRTRRRERRLGGTAAAKREPDGRRGMDATKTRAGSVTRAVAAGRPTLLAATDGSKAAGHLQGNHRSEDRPEHKDRVAS